MASLDQFNEMSNSYKSNMLKFIQDILNMEYHRNHHASSGNIHTNPNHENAIEEKLITHGFTKSVEITQIEKRTRDLWLTEPSQCSLNIGEFISQPCGSQDSPDFIIRISLTFVLPLEAKSSKSSTCPTYNSGGIKQNYLYIFSSMPMNQTTVYWGRDIITHEQQEIIDNLILQQKELERQANEELKKIDSNHRGISYYTRPMIQQSGGKEYTSYFQHIYRNDCERNVIEYFS